MLNRPVSLESLGVFLPQDRQTSEFIAAQTGIARDIIESRFGLRSKSVPGPEDHGGAMAAAASKQALERAGLTGEDIDCIIWAGESFAERAWQIYGILIQHLLGSPERPWGFDINQKCGTFIAGMMIAKAFLHACPDMQRVLVASGYRNSDLVDYQNERARSLIGLGASGVAAVLRADSSVNQLLGIASVTDPDFIDDVHLPAGGTERPFTAENLAQRQNYLDVFDPAGLEQRLEAAAMTNTLRALDRALAGSGLARDDLAYLALPHMERSAFERTAREIGVEPYARCEYLDDLGHHGQNDCILSLDRALQKGKVKDGDVLALTSAGIGWAWNAAIVRWGEGS